MQYRQEQFGKYNLKAKLLTMFYLTDMNLDISTILYNYIQLYIKGYYYWLNFNESFKLKLYRLHQYWVYQTNLSNINNKMLGKSSIFVN